MRPFLLSCLLTLLLLTASCSWFKKEPEESAPIPSGATAVAIPKTMYSQPVLDAVSGQVFSISRESRSAIFRGRHYYFQTPQGLKAFLDAPEDFIPDAPPVAAPDAR